MDESTLLRHSNTSAPALRERQLAVEQLLGAATFEGTRGVLDVNAHIRPEQEDWNTLCGCGCRQLLDWRRRETGDEFNA